LSAPKKQITFIINPIAGTRSKLNIPLLIETYLDPHKYIANILYSEYAGHASTLAKEAVHGAADCVVAVGGDGTMNEVANALVHTPVRLGLIPLGSGNGLARHLGIPLEVAEAIKVLNQEQEIKIDSVLLNDRHFFCTAGVGFDAHVGYLFAKQASRGLKSYVKTTLREFMGYRPHTYLLKADGKEYKRKAFVITFANAGQYGNNAYISPEASIQDGLIDVCILHPFPKSLAMSMGMRLFTKRMHRSRFMEIVRAKKISVSCQAGQGMHLDGEPCPMPAQLNMEIKPASLKVLIHDPGRAV
jgi:diacylglycerol kinase (ATP)